MADDGEARARTDSLELELEAIRAPARARLRRAALIAALGSILLTSYAIAHDHLVAVARGEADWLGDPKYEPPHGYDSKRLARVDFELLHGRVIPWWMIAHGRAHRQGGRAERERALQTLRAVVSPDPNLKELFEELDAKLREGALAHARRIDWLLWAYNAYIDAQRVPFRLEAALLLRQDGRAVFHTRSYRVLGDYGGRRGDPRVRLVRRADRTNIVEHYLGHTSRGDDGAIVVVDRILHFAVREVWPALHPALDARRPLRERALLPRVRDEVRAALPYRTRLLLEETAVDQQALVEVERSIHDRHWCGSRFRIWDLPYNGLAPEDRRELTAAVARGENSPCPEVTLEEAARMVGASERLGSERGIEDAIERLATFVTRAIAVHELRHAADGDGAIDCPGCPAGVDDATAAEMSGYLAAFGTPGLAHVAMLQACAEPWSGNDPHSRALRLLGRELVPNGCEGGAVRDLPARARRLERALFGERRSVRVPWRWPVALRLLPRRPEGWAARP